MARKKEKSTQGTYKRKGTKMKTESSMNFKITHILADGTRLNEEEFDGYIITGGPCYKQLSYMAREFVTRYIGDTDFPLPPIPVSLLCQVASREVSQGRQGQAVQGGSSQATKS